MFAFWLPQPTTPGTLLFGSKANAEGGFCLMPGSDSPLLRPSYGHLADGRDYGLGGTRQIIGAVDGLNRPVLQSHTRRRSPS